MWIRKSDEKIASDEKKKRSYIWLSFRGPVVLFLISFLFVVVSVSLGPRAPAASRPTSFSVLLQGAIFIATITAIASYVLQIIFRRKLSDLLDRWTGPNIVICDTCHYVKHRDSSKNNCDCGGNFEDFNKWQWIDEDNGTVWIRPPMRPPRPPVRGR